MQIKFDYEYNIKKERFEYVLSYIDKEDYKISATYVPKELESPMDILQGVKRVIDNLNDYLNKDKE